MSEAASLIRRAHALGADRRNTNYGGGNVSAKGTQNDPATGKPVELLWVKGSGGDLATLKESGLAVLELERMRGLTDVYRGEAHEDEMQGLLDYCRHGIGGAAPSIDTAMHGLLAPKHVDHLHPDAVIALAAAADGERLVKECFGDTVAWIPWRRPGFQLGYEIAQLQAKRPELIGLVLGGHGVTAWGATSEECEQRSLEIIRRATEFLAKRGRKEPFGKVRSGYEALPQAQRRERAAALFPIVRGLCSIDRQMIGSYSDDAPVLEFLSRERLRELAALGTSCPDHYLRTKVRPLVVDLPGTASLDDVVARLREEHAAYRKEYAAYYARHAEPDSPAMRGADPPIVLVPGVGMFSFGADAQTARVVGEFYRSAIAVMHGAEAVSTYAPIDEAEKFRIEYWGLEEAKLARRPKPRELAGRVAFVSGGASGIGRATARRLAEMDATIVVADLNADGARAVADELRARYGQDRAISVGIDVTKEDAVINAVREAVLAYGGIDVLVNSAGVASSAPITETSLADWERMFAILARGYFLTSREAFRVMRAQGTGGSIVMVASKNALVGGKNAAAYSAAKAAEVHLGRCLAEEGGANGIRVNSVNPDAVIADSAIWSGEWKRERAAAYGISEEQLPDFYRKRTTLGVDVHAEDIAEAIAFFASPVSSRSTGNILNVDGGVAAAYTR